MLSLLALCLPAAAQTAQPDVVLTFRATGTGTTAIASKDFFSKVLAESCASYVSSATLSGIYPSATAGLEAVKVGANSGKGILTIALAEPYQKAISQIIIEAKRFNAKGSPSVAINDLSSSSSLPSSSSDFGEMIFSGFGENYKDITITNGSTGAILLKSISIYFKTELEQVARQ